MPGFKEFAAAGFHAEYAWCAYGFVVVAMIGGVWVTKRGLRHALERAARRIEHVANKVLPPEG